KKIYRGEAWQKSRISPLTLPGIDVKEGEYLIAVGDKIIHYPENIYKYFENTTDKQIRITVNSKPSIKDARVIKIKPIDVDGEEELRYLDWVENNRKKVEKATNGKIGYIHVPNTAMWGLKEFGKYFFAQRDKEGLIIDVRYNGGGWSPMMFMDYLTQTPLSIFIPRYGEPHMDPFAKFRGNMVCLTNEYAGSGGDMFPYYFRELGLGKLIGATTWGGLLSCSGRKLMDGGLVVLPMYEVTNVENEKLLENEGVHPDIEIDNPPNLLMKGRDLQLEKAIEVLSK
ncbi:PDZ domain-containing protein, partial [candidate division WOR-3 bacterium]|nr:PDZ domain-containing protein [candidate division WOR-3 bacterium]